MSQYRIDFRAMQWETPVAGVRLKARAQNGRRPRLVEFSRDFVEPNWCTKGHIGYVLEGQIEINFGGRLIMFGPDDGIFIPAGEAHKHKGKATTDAVKMILVEE